MKLIWTYSSKLKREPVNYIITKNDILTLYTNSILNGKKFHKTCIYVSEEDSIFFKNLVDEIVILPENFDYYFLDDIKFYVIANEIEPYTLIDGDIFIEEKIPYLNVDIAFERNLKLDKLSYYTKYNTILEDNGLLEILSYWESNQDTFNIGLITIYNKIDFSKFISDYNKIKIWYKEIIEPKYNFLKNNVCIEMSMCTYFITQYIKHYNISYDYLNLNMKFKHYAGTKRKISYLRKIKNNLI
jgi:hypothetical protein